MMATQQATNLPLPVLLLTCILALATGLALLGVATALTARPVSTRSAAYTRFPAAAIAAAEQFFAAVNEAMRAGEPGAARGHRRAQPGRASRRRQRVRRNPARPTLERVRPEPGALVTRSVAVGQTLILVERGTSWMASAGHRGLWVLAGDGGWRPRAPAGAVVPGDLVQLAAGQAGTWRAGADEPVALLVLSTGPAAKDPGKHPALQDRHRYGTR